ncbi:hypothetical protein AABM38_10795 [Heyndrickxia sp. MSNUG]|uniref:hypothetical protein n=1 Tax=Heyndrickxia sp. MSNUG TaxID=3136677 RepID=UPI003C2F1F5D
MSIKEINDGFLAAGLGIEAGFLYFNRDFAIITSTVDKTRLTVNKIRLTVNKIIATVHLFSSTVDIIENGYSDIKKSL